MSKTEVTNFAKTVENLKKISDERREYLICISLIDNTIKSFNEMVELDSIDGIINELNDILTRLNNLKKTIQTKNFNKTFDYLGEVCSFIQQIITLHDDITNLNIDKLKESVNNIKLNLFWSKLNNQLNYQPTKEQLKILKENSNLLLTIITSAYQSRQEIHLESDILDILQGIDLEEMQKRLHNLKTKDSEIYINKEVNQSTEPDEQAPAEGNQQSPKLKIVKLNRKVERPEEINPVTNKVSDPKTYTQNNSGNSLPTSVHAIIKAINNPQSSEEKITEKRHTKIMRIIEAIDEFYKCEHELEASYVLFQKFLNIGLYKKLFAGDFLINKVKALYNKNNIGFATENEIALCNLLLNKLLLKIKKSYTPKKQDLNTKLNDLYKHLMEKNTKLFTSPFRIIVDQLIWFDESKKGIDLLTTNNILFRDIDKNISIVSDYEMVIYSHPIYLDFIRDFIDYIINNRSQDVNKKSLNLINNLKDKLDYLKEIINYNTSEEDRRSHFENILLTSEPKDPNTINTLSKIERDDCIKPEEYYKQQLTEIRDIHDLKGRMSEYIISKCLIQTLKFLENEATVYLVKPYSNTDSMGYDLLLQKEGRSTKIIPFQIVFREQFALAKAIQTLDFESLQPIIYLINMGTNGDYNITTNTFANQFDKFLNGWLKDSIRSLVMDFTKFLTLDDYTQNIGSNILTPSQLKYITGQVIQSIQKDIESNKEDESFPENTEGEKHPSSTQNEKKYDIPEITEDDLDLDTVIKIYEDNNGGNLFLCLAKMYNTLKGEIDDNSDLESSLANEVKDKIDTLKENDRNFYTEMFIISIEDKVKNLVEKLAINVNDPIEIYTKLLILYNSVKREKNNQYVGALQETTEEGFSQLIESSDSMKDVLKKGIENIPNFQYYSFLIELDKEEDLFEKFETFITAQHEDLVNNNIGLFNDQDIYRINKYLNKYFKNISLYNSNGKTFVSSDECVTPFIYYISSYKKITIDEPAITKRPFLNRSSYLIYNMLNKDSKGFVDKILEKFEAFNKLSICNIIKNKNDLNSNLTSLGFFLGKHYGLESKIYKDWVDGYKHEKDGLEIVIKIIYIQGESDRVSRPFLVLDLNFSDK